MLEKFNYFIGNGGYGRVYYDGNKRALKKTDYRGMREFNFMKIVHELFSPLDNVKTPRAIQLVNQSMYIMEYIDFDDEMYNVWNVEKESMIDLIDAFRLMRRYDINHYDLHDENVMIDKNGKFVIMDFGQACYCSPDENDCFTAYRYYGEIMRVLETVRYKAELIAYHWLMKLADDLRQVIRDYTSSLVNFTVCDSTYCYTQIEFDTLCDVLQGYIEDFSYSYEKEYEE